jgi:hypothetical protein
MLNLRAQVWDPGAEVLGGVQGRIALVDWSPVRFSVAGWEPLLELDSRSSPFL